MSPAGAHADPGNPAAGVGAQHRAPARERPAKNWDGHVASMELLAATPAFTAIRDQILEMAELRAADTVLDIGAGTGLLALAAAPRVAQVSALDVSPAMCHYLEVKRRRLGIANMEVLNASAVDLPIGDAQLDAVVSNYCLHHLRDAEKIKALGEIYRVLRPGGRLVFGDMMFSLSLTGRRDRAVIGRVVRRMVSRGPAGVIRVARNAARQLGGRGEHPARVQWWQDALLQAGFTEVSVQALDHEGGVAAARRP
ncbi:MAG: class I SAM-dependent methyltransferase [Solirubrobacteraceae bacterium]